MKKIVYLLLISLLFASCKKKANQAETNVPLLKGRWKTQAIQADCFDVNGNLINTEYLEIPESEGFYMEFDGNNRAIYSNLDNIDEKSGFYTYQNGYLTIFTLNNNAKISEFVSQLTPNNMTWQIEPEEDNPGNLDFPGLNNPRQISKILIYLHFDKVK